MNGNGAYLDVGVGATRDNSHRTSTAGSESGLIGYARFIVPLGKRVRRLDCSRLYNLEIERLEMEIEMLRMGLGDME